MSTEIKINSDVSASLDRLAEMERVADRIEKAIIVATSVYVGKKTDKANESKIAAGFIGAADFDKEMRDRGIAGYASATISRLLRWYDEASKENDVFTARGALVPADRTDLVKAVKENLGRKAGDFFTEINKRANASNQQKVTRKARPNDGTDKKVESTPVNAPAETGESAPVNLVKSTTVETVTVDPLAEIERLVGSVTRDQLDDPADASARIARLIDQLTALQSALEETVTV